jgi:hypothetical protein
MKTKMLRFVLGIALPVSALIFTAAPASAQYSSPMRDIDNPARQPFNFGKNLVLSFNTPSQLFLSDPSFTVPAGKRLVIETLSIYVALAPGQLGLVKLGTLAGGVGVTHVFPLTKTYSLSSGEDVYTGLHSIRMYADPGSTVFITAERNTVAGIALDAVFKVVITGYYVNLP